MPHDKSAFGKANLDGRFGGLIVWHPKGSEAEHRFQVFVIYEGEESQPKKPCAVEITFDGNDPHRITTQAEFNDPLIKEWINACIQS